MKAIFLRLSKAAALSVLSVLSVPPSSASDARAFVWEQANAQAAAASSPSNYLAAAETYNRLVADGARNGPLFLNLGAALVLAGDGANAAAAFARAERHLGATPETRQCLAAALALQTGRARADLPWSRTAFFWHYAFPCSVRVCTALGGWTLFWLGLFLYRLKGSARPPDAPSGSARPPGALSGNARSPNAPLRSLAETFMLTGGLTAAVFAASALMTLAHERHDAATWGARVFAASAPDETEALP